MRIRIALATLSAFLCTAVLADRRMVVLLIGPPGAGKTTQARKISHKYHIPSISMSDLLKNDAGWGKAGSKNTWSITLRECQTTHENYAAWPQLKRL
jgi:broad-specificity NMP kinase